MAVIEKSTLLNILGLPDNPTGGQYFPFEKEVENAELPLIYLKIKASERKKTVADILKRMNISHRVVNLFDRKIVTDVKACL